MSPPRYFSDPGPGQKRSEVFHYSQAVVIGDIVKCSAQGGWDTNGYCDPNDLEAQVQNAFDNVDRVLKTAGLRGWDDVYSVRSYHVDMDASFELMIELLKKRIPGHRPIWTPIATPRLASPIMLIEIEVEAVKHKA
jgi:enamine deaminase RidA (YjgF/YER057c/UK114 family)